MSFHHGGGIRSKIVYEIMESANLNRREAESAFDTTLHVITDSLKRGNKVVLTGFGTFSVTRRQARLGRNPSTGEQIRIPSKRVLKFKPGKGLIKKVQTK